MPVSYTHLMAGAGASPYELASDAASRLGIAVGAEELATLALSLIHIWSM